MAFFNGLGVLDRVDYAALIASPGECAEVFLIVEGDSLAGEGGELLGDLLVRDGEAEFFGLDALGVFVAGAVAGEDHHAFIGLEDIALAGDLVELSGLDAFAEDVEEAEVAECRKAEDEDNDDPGENFLERCHNRNV